MSNFENEIGSLSAAQKFELIDVLWESLEAEGTAITDEQTGGTRLSRCQV